MQPVGGLELVEPRPSELLLRRTNLKADDQQCDRPTEATHHAWSTPGVVGGSLGSDDSALTPSCTCGTTRFTTGMSHPPMAQPGPNTVGRPSVRTFRT